MRLGYTLFCLIALAITVSLELVLRTGILRDRRYWITLAIVLGFQLLADGWLTCRPIVTYAERQFSGVRLGCPSWSVFRAGGMPLEDLAFGGAMITQGLMWWRWWGPRWNRSSDPELVCSQRQAPGAVPGGPEEED